MEMETTLFQVLVSVSEKMVGVLEMKKLAYISSFLLSKEHSAALKLQQQSYLIIIPKDLVEKQGLVNEFLEFDLVILDNKLSLLGPKVSNPRVRQSTVSEETVT